MGTVVLRHIHKLRAEVANGALLIDEILYGKVARHAHRLVGLHKVHVAIQHAAHIGCIRNHGEYLLQIEMVQRSRNVLFGLLVLIVGVDLHAGAVVSTQHQVGRHAVVASEEDVVVVVHREFPVSQHGLLAVCAEHQAVILHRSLQAETHSQLALVVIETCAKDGAAVLQHAVDEGIEGVLWVLVVVAHLCLIGGTHRVGANGEVHRVEQHTVNHERLQVQTSIQAVDGR